MTLHPFPDQLQTDADDELVPHLTHDPTTGLPWPAPAVPEPDFVTLRQLPHRLARCGN